MKNVLFSHTPALIEFAKRPNEANEKAKIRQEKAEEKMKLQAEKEKKVESLLKWGNPSFGIYDRYAGVKQADNTKPCIGQYF